MLVNVSVDRFKEEQKKCKSLASMEANESDDLIRFILESFKLVLINIVNILNIN